MITVKKGQTVDFRGSKVPLYIKETKEAARELARGLELEREACATKDSFLKQRVKIKTSQKRETQIPVILGNKIKKLRNATHQEG
ncbi:MAG TPA: hypothetical protein DDW93_06815 [Firmicutes bacterium]|jgi:TusA-related sulfurtransferase|nr:hypothetical protein [Bacillota bacterium]HBK69619.1 hypothetical protein [Bacillota bacterium]HBT17994.1 hypothetical protein [Bacillota bacterium]